MCPWVNKLHGSLHDTYSQEGGGGAWAHQEWSFAHSEIKKSHNHWKKSRSNWSVTKFLLYELTKVISKHMIKYWNQMLTTVIMAPEHYSIANLMYVYFLTMWSWKLMWKRSHFKQVKSVDLFTFSFSFLPWVKKTHVPLCPSIICHLQPLKHIWSFPFDFAISNHNLSLSILII